MKRKLAPRWVGPFRVSARRGSNAYVVTGLPDWLSGIHTTFNISQLKPAAPPSSAISDHQLDDSEYQVDRIVQ